MWGWSVPTGSASIDPTVSTCTFWAMPHGEKVDDCDLCEAAKITHWFHEDDVCWIAECEICDTPMVVWRWHGVDPDDTAMQHMHAQLARVAGDVFDGHYLDDNIERKSTRLNSSH